MDGDLVSSERCRLEATSILPSHLYFVLSFLSLQGLTPTFIFFYFRYAKVNELLTSCRIGAKFDVPLYDDDFAMESVKDSHPFLGQVGPVYLFNDAISSEQVQGIYSLGPSYMYSFLDNEAASSKDNPVLSGVLDVKDGLASKIIFGLNAQVLSFSWKTSSL